MQDRSINLVLTLSSLIGKAVFIVGASVVLQNAEFSSFVNYFNLLVIGGYLAGLEHHARVSRNYLTKKIGAKPEKYFLKWSVTTLFYRSAITTALLGILVPDVGVTHLFIWWIILFIDTACVDYSRFLYALSAVRSAAALMFFRISSAVLAGLFFIAVDTSTEAFLTVYVLIQICLMTLYDRHFLITVVWIGLASVVRKRNIIYFVLLMRSVLPYLVVGVVGFISPLIDKILIENYQATSLIKPVVYGGIAGGILVSVLSAYVIQPAQKSIVSKVTLDKLNDVMQQGVAISAIFIISVSMALLALDEAASWMPELNGENPFQSFFEETIVWSFVILSYVVASIFQALSMPYSLAMYGWSMDSLLMGIALTEIILKTMALALLIGNDRVELLGLVLILVNVSIFISKRNIVNAELS